ncbi:DUF4411 family protein [Paraburkholderia tropica]|uniref:DUF4411 family protein n=1 Tax=Paraburkholderia tropica TaxID=92647 RepID=UPI002AB30892|nr:DUF4411 family protein [Paraburkholderia tropica]
MYLLDTNIFIEAQNRYYASDICPGFWNWLDDANARGVVASIGEVYDELAGRGDSLAQWIEARRGTGWFIDVSDAATQASFAEVVQHVESVARYTRPNKNLFLNGADPWLIAKAKTIGWGVATHEQYSENSTKVKIPNVCRNFGVNSRDTFDVLRQLQASFGWNRPN